MGFDSYGLKTMEVKLKQASLLQNQIQIESASVTKKGPYTKHMDY
jgi:hypothetical protein